MPTCKICWSYWKELEKDRICPECRIKNIEKIKPTNTGISKLKGK